MRINGKTIEGIEIEGETTEELNELCYLGSIITKYGEAESDVNVRINTAKGAFVLLRQLWRSKDISRNTKFITFNTNIKSALLLAYMGVKLGRLLKP
jgi:hypothetical protein